MRLLLAALALLASALSPLAQTTAPYPTLQHQRPETGAVRRTVDQRLKDTIHAADFGILCNGTDETTKFNTLSTAIGSGGKTVLLPRGQCVVSGWSLANKKNLSIVGEGGLDMDNINAGTELSCTSSGSGVCFNFVDTKGLVVQKIAFTYTSPTFTGTLIDMRSSASVWSKNRFSNVAMFQRGASTFSADRLVDVYHTVDVTFDTVRFSHARYGLVGANTGIDGQSSASLRCYSCDFVAIQGAAVLNPGLNWSFISSNFEPAFPDLHPSGILFTAPNIARSLSVINSTFSDATGDGYWIYTDGAFGLNVVGSSFAGSTSADSTAIRLGGAFNAGINITGNLITFEKRGIWFTGGAGTCSGANITGNAFTGTTTAVVSPEICDANSNFDGNSPPIGRPRGTQYGGTGLDGTSSDGVMVTSGANPVAVNRAVLDAKGHAKIGFAAPNYLGCGTSPTLTVNSTDAGGTIITGSGNPTACTITWANAYAVVPSCVVMARDGQPFLYTPTTTQLNFSFSAASGRTFDWVCHGN